MGRRGYVNQWTNHPSYYWDLSRRHIRDNTLLQFGGTIHYTGHYNQDYYAGRQRFYFIVPRAGRYRFLLNSDDQGSLYRHYPETGYFEKLTYISRHQSLWDYDYRVYDQHSRTFQFEKDEEVALEMYFEEGNGGDYGVVGVQFMGENYDTRFGKWINFYSP